MSQDYRPLTYHYFKKNKTRRKLPSLKTVKNKLDLICKLLTRAAHGNICYTCGRQNLKGTNWHTSHFIPKKCCGTYLKYDLRNMRPSCYHCNINLGGNGAAFYKNMVEREGQKYVDGIFEDRNRITKEREFLPELLVKYERILEANKRP